MLQLFQDTDFPDSSFSYTGVLLFKDGCTHTLRLVEIQGLNGGLQSVVFSDKLISKCLLLCKATRAKWKDDVWMQMVSSCDLPISKCVVLDEALYFDKLKLPHPYITGK